MISENVSTHLKISKFHINFNCPGFLEKGAILAALVALCHLAELTRAGECCLVCHSSHQSLWPCAALLRGVPGPQGFECETLSLLFQFVVNPVRVEGQQWSG